MRQGIIPSMRLKDTINIFCRRDGDKGGRLLDLDTIIVINEAHVSERGFVFPRESEASANDIIDSFGDFLIRASKGKIINLAEEKNFDTVKRRRIDRAIVCGAFEVQFWCDRSLQ